MATFNTAQAAPVIAGHRILRLIGRGAMGVVYLAHDSRLDRRVAIKVLPDAFAQDGDRLAGLRREARVLASLNHPNIAAIYGLVESENGEVALILEWIEGQSLAQRLQDGPLPLVEALFLGRQIGEALEAAHERGVIHRDMKPANVMVTSEGTVKLVDFGLARSSPPPRGTLQDSPTSTLPLSTRDRVIGTPGYMSPEQARGLPLDRRTDVFAFGCVLFECLSGRRAFPGETEADVMAATLTSEPDWIALREDTPASVRVLLEQCLQRDPDRRFPDLSDARLAIEAVLEERVSAAPGAHPIGRSTPNNLPATLTSFVGRERQIQDLKLLLSHSRLVTLTGTGGCGKTRVANQVAGELLSDYPDGVWLVELASLNDSAHVPSALATILRVQEKPNQPLEQTLVDRLKGQRVLLVLDNCEHLLAACAQLARTLLLACSDLRILATSREHLAVPGEQNYHVPSLSLPDGGQAQDPDRLVQSESVRLFLDRARLVQSDWTLTDDDTPAVAEICRRLDGIPLAIELAAARVRVLSVAQINAKLSEGLRLLTSGSTVTVPRQQTLRATLDWSYELLSADERRLLRSLSVFAGGWTLEAAVAVCGEGLDEFGVLDLLTHLADKSLVVVDRGAGGHTRYRLLETVRQHAQEELIRRGEGGVLHGRHLDYFVLFGEDAAPKLRGPEQALWLRWIGTEHENLLLALEWSGNTEDGAEKGLRLIAAIWPFWETRGQLGLGRTLAARVLESDRAAKPTRSRARALLAAGNMARGQSDHTRARIHFQASLSIERELKNKIGMARSLGSLGLLALDEEDESTAQSLFEEALPLFRELDDKGGVETTLMNLAILLRHQGHPDQARELQEEALQIGYERGDKRRVEIGLYNLAVISLAAKDYPAANDQLVQALDIARELGDKPVAASILERVSELAVALEAPARAVRLRAAAASIRESISVPLPPKAVRERDRFMGEARARLDERSFDKEWETGLSMSFEEALTCAFEGLGRRVPS